MSSKVFGTKVPVKGHLVRGGGGLSGEINDVRSDVEEAFVTMEAGTSVPRIVKVTGGSYIDPVTVPIARVITGTSFLQGQTKATLTKGLTTASLAFTANRPGTPGNSITVVITQGSGGLVVSAAGNVATIELASGTSTAAAVKAAWDAAATTARLAQVAVSAGGGGTVLVSSVESLSGGLGAGVTVKINDVEQDVNGSITDTSIPMLAIALTGAVNYDSAALQVVSDGVASDMFPLAVLPTNSFRSAAAAPSVTKVTGGGSVSLGGIPVNKGIVGTGFTQGQTKATLVLGTGTAALTFTANRYGTPGNSITVVITQGLAGLVVSATGDAATIELAAAGSTANAVKSAWDAEPTTNRLAQVASGGTGTVLVASVLPLATGTGTGISVKANGIEQGINGAVTDTVIPLVVTDLTGAANLDKVALKVTSNGVAAETFSLDVVT
jgi:hypothetical protein